MKVSRWKNLSVFVLVLFTTEAWCKIQKNEASIQPLTACKRPTKAYDMAVNNVRARLSNDGTLFSAAKYTTPIPKSGEKEVAAIYAASVWIGGVDKSNNIKLAAGSYKQRPSDFFAGPLDINGAAYINSCDQWDRIFTVKGSSIHRHILNVRKLAFKNIPISCVDIPEDILYWPAQGNPYFESKMGWKLPDQPLAAFFDFDHDDLYDPCKGDYPIVADIDFNCIAYHFLETKIPSEINYFVINDNGGPHLLSGPGSIQMELHVNAYAFSTADVLNNSTFYQYKMVNKANEDIVDFYFSWWVDPDLGCYKDDYIGCDPARGMAYVYNQDALDGDQNGNCDGINTYGSDIPVLGFDIVKEPWLPKVFKRNPDGSFALDQNGRKIIQDPPPFTGDIDTLVQGGMSSFSYMESCAVVDFPAGMSNPQFRREDGFYNYMRGYWADGTPITKSGFGYNPLYTNTTKFAFGDDPNNSAGWSMCTADIPVGDKTFIMSVGPMLLQPGATNSLTMGIFSVSDMTLPCPDLTRLKYAHDYMEHVLQNCFDTVHIDLPACPNMNAIPGDHELVLTLDNPSHLFLDIENFRSGIPYVRAPFDSLYRFEGYKIYQVKGKDILPSQLNNAEFARLIEQTDVKNGIKDIYTWKTVPNPDQNAADKFIWIPELAVAGSDKGIKTTFKVSKDYFMDEDLINGKEYHYAVVSYAHNNWRPFDYEERYGQNKTYLEGRRNFKVYTFKPEMTSETMEAPVVTRISGEGNPGVFLEMDDEMYEKVFQPNFNGHIKYKPNKSPVFIQIIDKEKLKTSRYRLELDGRFLQNNNGTQCEYDKDAVWKLVDINTQEVILQEISLFDTKEYYLKELGFSISIQNFAEPGRAQDLTLKGGIGAKLTYKNSNEIKWFNAIIDGGKYHPNIPAYNVYDFVDDVPQSENINTINLNGLGDGFFVPILSARRTLNPDLPFYISPAPKDVAIFSTSPNLNALRYRDLNNIDIVFTNDKSKWSKCIVVETTPNELITSEKAKTIGNARNFDLRNSPSIDQDGKPLQDGTVGMSYFPGYAVDVETGKRLNIFFGESSWFSGENAEILQGKNPIGGDLIFNPSSQAVIEDFVIRHPETGAIIGVTDPRAYVVGGHHYIYVTRMEYDECQSFYSRLRYSVSGSSPSLNNKHRVLSSVTWTCIPVPQAMLPLSQGLIPNDLKVQIRVDNPYGSSRRFDPASERACLTDGDRPIYEFGFEKINSIFEFNQDKTMVFPNPANSQAGNLNITIIDLPKKGTLTITDSFGNLTEHLNISDGTPSFVGPKGAAYTFELKSNSFKSGIYLIQITDGETGKVKTAKWVVL
jgi:hypothetical protein